jgi:hypothetical protein
MTMDKEIEALLRRLRPMAKEMIGQSGPWDTCPFCGGGQHQIPWHEADCPLRALAFLKLPND